MWIRILLGVSGSGSGSRKARKIPERPLKAEKLRNVMKELKVLCGGLKASPVAYF
jgi:hypothetical protein